MPNNKLKLCFELFSTTEEVDHLFSDVIEPKNIISTHHEHDMTLTGMPHILEDLKKLFYFVTLECRL